MSFERFNVLTVFENPEQADNLYIYEIVNYTGTKEITFKQNSINHIFLKMWGSVKGVTFEHKKEVSLKSYNAEKEAYAINLKTTKRFASNETALKEVLQKPSNYVFSLQEWKEGSDVELFLIAECDIDEQKLFAKEFEELDVNQEQKLFSQYYELVLASYNDVTKTSGIIINFLEAWEEQIEEIINIEYEIPPNTLLSSINVFGDMYNETTGDLLENVLLPLEIKKSPNLLPIWANLNSLENPYEVNIKNFKEDFQLDFEVAKRVCVEFYSNQNKTSIERVFEIYDPDVNFGEKQKKELISLYKKLFVFSYLYKTNFKDFNYLKHRQDFAVFFNNNFANKSAWEHSLGIVEEFKLKNKNYEKAKLFQVFKGLCYASSSFLVSPFMADLSHDENVFFKSIWFYFDLNNFILNVEQIFIFEDLKTNFAFKDDWENYFNIVLSFASNYFLINDKKEIILKNKKGFYKNYFIEKELKNLEKQNQYYYNPKEDSNISFNNYLFFVLSEQNIHDFINKYANNNLVNNIDLEVTKITYNEPLDIKDWALYLPLKLRKNPEKYIKNTHRLIEDATARNIECKAINYDVVKRLIIRTKEEEKDNDQVTVLKVGESNHPDYCEAIYHDGKRVILDDNAAHFRTGFIERKFKFEKHLIKLIFKNTAKIQYQELKNKNNKHIINYADLLIYKFQNIKNFYITFQLKESYSDFNWKIRNVKKDIFSSVWNSAIKIILHGRTKNKKNIKKIIDLNYSYQKNNPLITTTENLY